MFCVIRTIRSTNNQIGTMVIKIHTMLL